MERLKHIDVFGIDMQPFCMEVPKTPTCGMKVKQAKSSQLYGHQYETTHKSWLGAAATLAIVAIVGLFCICRV